MSPKAPMTPKMKTPRNHTEALRVLNKAKKFRQLDLKKSVVKRNGLTEEELAELQQRAEEERRRWLEVWEEEKRKRREERMEKLRALQEQKRLERIRQREMMRPREDTLCTDSKVHHSLNTYHPHTHSLAPSPTRSFTLLCISPSASPSSH